MKPIQSISNALKYPLFAGLIGAGLGVLSEAMWHGKKISLIHLGSIGLITFSVYITNELSTNILNSLTEIIVENKILTPLIHNRLEKKSVKKILFLLIKGTLVTGTFVLGFCFVGFSLDFAQVVTSIIVIASAIFITKHMIPHTEANEPFFFENNNFFGRS